MDFQIIITRTGDTTTLKVDAPEDYLEEVRDLLRPILGDLLPPVANSGEGMYLMEATLASANERGFRMGENIPLTAIKELRDLTGKTLVEAKEIIEAVRAGKPWLFSSVIPKEGWPKRYSQRYPHLKFEIRPLENKS